MAVVRTEAAMEISSFSGVSEGRICLTTSGTVTGFNPIRMRSAVCRRGDIVGRNIDPPLSGELPGSLLVLHRGHNLLRLKHLGLEKGLEQNPAHLPGSENGYPEAGKRMSGCVCTHRISLGYFCVFCCVFERDPAVDPLLQQIERQSSGIQYLIVEGAEVKSFPQRLLGPGP